MSNEKLIDDHAAEVLRQHIEVAVAHRDSVLTTFVITDDESAAGAAMAIKDVSKQVRAVEAERKEVVAPLVANKRDADAWYKQWSGPYEEINKYLRKQLAEYERKKEETRRKALAAAVDADTPEEARALLVKSATKSSKVQGVSTLSFTDYEVVDLSKVPREFLRLDEQKVKRHLQEQGESAKIEGLRIFINKRIRA